MIKSPMKTKTHLQNEKKLKKDLLDKNVLVISQHLYTTIAVISIIYLVL